MDLVDQVLHDHASEVVDMKKKIEAIWKESSTKRERRTLASRDAPGYSFFGDNVGT